MKASELLDKYKNGERDFSLANLYGANLEGATLKVANLYWANLKGANLKVANLKGANLYEANLYGANLYEANLYGANLKGANLYEANLKVANLYEANLKGANLYGANLYGANLYGANLYGANLYGANLYGANLYGANLKGAKLPSPSVVLLASWGVVSDELCADLMRYDAFFHDYKKSFDRWADGGLCPYNCKKFQRAANFSETKELWKWGPPKNGFSLMVRCIQEKCANSDWHKK
jgi:hypothetical protein